MTATLMRSSPYSQPWGTRRPSSKIIRGLFGRPFGSAVLLCRWSRVLGHLTETAVTGCRCNG